MKIPPSAMGSFLRQCRHRARHVLVGGVLALGVTVAPGQNAISTYAGAALTAGSADTTTGPATLARFNNPQGVATDAAGNVYVTDAMNGAVRRITPAGVVSTLATGLANPTGIAVDGAGVLYVANTGNHTIIRISGASIVTIAGSPGQIGHANNTTGTNARFYNPTGIAVNSAGVGGAGTIAYVADTSNHVIRRLDLTGTIAVTTIAGTAVEGVTGGTSGTLNATPGTAARFFGPYALALDAAGANLYVADYYNHAIRRVDLTSSNAVSTFAGTAGSFGNSDAPALFQFPSGVAIDASGSVYVVDRGNNTLRKVTSTGTVSTLAGTPGATGTADGLGANARFNSPFGIASKSDGTVLYIADTLNQTIRRATAATAPVITSQPASLNVAAGATATFTVAATGNPTPTFQWYLGGAAIPGATNSSYTITPVSAAHAGSYTVVVTNVVNSVTSSAATLTVTQAPAFTNATTAFAFPVGSTTSSFTVTASGSPAPTFAFVSGSPPDWLTLNTSTGAISTLSAVPASAAGNSYTFTIRAANSAGTADQSFTLTVQNAPVITTPPANQVVSPGQSAIFSVVASGVPAPTAYQWYRIPTGGAAVALLNDFTNYSGVTTTQLSVSNPTLAMNGEQFYVVVSNGVGSTNSPTATLTVTQPPTQFTSTSTATFVVGQMGSFLLQANGTPLPTYQVISGSFPWWLSLQGSTGLLTSTTLVPAEAGGQTYQFTVRASNGGTPLDLLFTLVVSTTPISPVITTHPQNQTVGLGQAATFNAIASANPAPSYQWQRYRVGDSGYVLLQEGVDGYSGTNTSTLHIANVTAAMGSDLYQVIVANIHGTVTSNSAQLTISLGSVFSTVAGQPGVAGSADGTGTTALFRAPNAITVDSAGNIYVADAGNHVIRKITSGGVVSTLAGAAGATGSVDGVGGAARFNMPSGVAVDAAGNVYVADSGNHIIRVISAAGNVTTLAGAPQVIGSTDGAGSQARFSFPSGIAVDIIGTIYVADTYNHTIRKITSGSLVTTLAGLPASPGTANGSGNGARFAYPNGLAVDATYNIYVADSQGYQIRKISPAGVVSSLAGLASSPGSTDGNGVGARFSLPQGVAVDTGGNVYVADTGNHLIRRITPAGDVATIAGLAGAAGSADGSGNTVRFNQPYGVAVDAAGNIYVADTFNHTIRRSGAVAAPQITTQPQNQVVALGGSVTFNVAVSGSPAASYQWQRQAAGTGDFVNISNDGIYSGTSTAALTVSYATNAMNGDQFRVIASNLVNPPATSNTATLTIIAPPTFTNAGSAAFRATQPGSFAFTVNSGLPITYSATGLPSWASLNATTGVLTGTAPDTSGSPFTLLVTANPGTGASTAATQSFVLTVEPANSAPAITVQPGNAAVNRGDAAAFTVTATGTPPLTYQWKKDGAAINGATSATFILPNAQAANSGPYSVTVTNAIGSANSIAANLTVNSPPVFEAQPRAQVAFSGGTVVFNAGASGGMGLTYQWRRNGEPISGANAASLTLNNVTTGDAGNYDVVVTNALGSQVSSMATLFVADSPVPPAFTLQPANRTVPIGGVVTLTAAASGAPAPAYQWRKNGINIPGATGAALSLGSIQPADAGSYDVVAANSVGTATSGAGVLRVIARSYAGVYFGAFSGGAGNFALHIRDDNTGVFLGYLPGSSAPVMSLNLSVNDSGQFSFSQGAVAAAAGPGEPPRAAMLGPVTVNGQISPEGVVNGSLFGGSFANLTGARSPTIGDAQNFAGYYQAGAANSGAALYGIANANGQLMVVAQVGGASDGGLGSLGRDGQVAVATGRSTIAGNVAPASGVLNASASGALSGTFSGGSETALATQRLLNISSRARVGAGEAVAIAGFVISGQESKPILIRAVGPTLGQAPFNIPGALSNPRLEVFRSGVSVASNSGVGSGTSSAAISAAARQIGAFALGNSGNDAALLLTLAPGNYTAVVSSVTTNTGVVLVEAYDLSAASAGQKLLNISTRATAGSAENTLIAGVVVAGSVPKRVLVRAVGPGLAPFGVTGVLAQPTLTLFSGSQPVASNTGWSTSADAAAISSGSVQVGAFTMANQDSALIATLPPGNYTAQVTGAGTATGIALVEVYELP